MSLIILKIFLGSLISYLLGAVPTAYLIGRLWRGVDIRQHGSGNVGATNAFRVLGKIPGVIVLGVDVLKGVLAGAAVPTLLGLDRVMYYVIFGMIAVVGHNWTVFLRFKGGKGIATTLGVMMALAIKLETIRMVLGLSLLTWGLVFVFSGFVSLASMVTATALPLYMLLTNQSFSLVIMAIVVCLFVTLRHRSNLIRLLSGQEPQIKFFGDPKKK